jgi:FtsP/CotA-like multicopper oxidase with cupredoxin domain
MHEPGSEQDSRKLEFPRETEGLPEVRKSELVELADGDEFELEIIPVKKRIGDATVRMLAYNGSVPGPTLKVPQGATFTVHVSNRGDLKYGPLAACGENRYDGTHGTQAPIPVGETLPTNQVPIRRIWYHPASARLPARSWACTETSCHPERVRLLAAKKPHELLLTLDDILIQDGQIAAFSGSETTHVAMGRFGNVMLVAGEPDRSKSAGGRAYFTNTANTRVST